MSNVVIELSREDARFVRQVLAFYEGYHLQNDVLQGKCKRLREFVLESEKADRSVIEWHSAEEEPELGVVVMTRGKDGIISADITEKLSDHPGGWGFIGERCGEEKVVAWAYLPEGGEDAP